MAGMADALVGFNGSVVEPGDATYEVVRSVHNGLIDKRPSVIARCHNVADVVLIFGSVDIVLGEVDR